MLVRLRPVKCVVGLAAGVVFGLACVVVSVGGYAPAGVVGKYVALAAGWLSVGGCVWLLISNVGNRFAVLRSRGQWIEVVYPVGLSWVSAGPISLKVGSREFVEIVAVDRLPDGMFVDFTVEHQGDALHFEVARSVLDADWSERFGQWQDSD